MLTILFKHILSLTIDLRCFYDTLFRLGIDKLLHLVIMILNSSIEKSIHSNTSLDEISFKMSALT